MQQKGFICLKKNKEILIATSNKGKVDEFTKLFDDYDILSLVDLTIDDAIEDGTSFLENALIKAKFISQKLTTTTQTRPQTTTKNTQS